MSGLRVADFDFDLPAELIAQQPPAERGQSRMLEMSRADGALRDASFADFPSLLSPGDLLVLNESRVIPARLYARRMRAPGAPLFPRSSAERVGEQEFHPASARQQPTGEVEVLLTEPAARPGGGNLWRALVKPGRKVGVGERLAFPSPTGAVELEAEVLERGQFGERLLSFQPVEDFFAVLDRIGHIPLPPYIRREDAAQDRERYQTVFSRERGSVAAPTAGLHFTPQVLDALTAKGVEIARITLHVGLGTFAPLRVERVDEVRLHRERYTLSAAAAEAINRARRERRRIVAVGTTVVRTLEHCAFQAHLASQAADRLLQPDGSPLSPAAGQFQPASGQLQPADCPLQPASEWLQPHSGVTEIFISPGFEFRLVGALLTNFHLPQSSLLMLVSAFAGREPVLAAYRHAVHQKYRFFSYGDCMFLS
jgi:S-adenosylmethionine:tRNA ribosyltransferase-isomerase